MPSLFSNLKRKNLEKQLANLIEEYEVANNQLGHTLEDVQRLQLQRKIAALEREIEQTENKVRQISDIGPAQDGRREDFSQVYLWILIGSVLILTIGGVFFARSQSWSWFQPPETCNYLRSTQQPGTFKVYIADFETNKASTDSNSYPANQLFDKLTHGAEDKIIICRTHQVISNSSEARSRGKSLSATLMIWGRQDSDSIDIGLEVIDWPPLAQVFTQNFSDQASNVVSETETLFNLVVLKTNSTLSELYSGSDQLGKARRILTSALAEAIRQKLDVNKPKEVAETYWFLGSLLQIPPEPNYEQALKVYDKAWALDDTLDVALFNKGTVYEDIEEPDRAIAIYTQLIEANSEMIMSALDRRAHLLAQQADRKAAERDLEELIKLEPLAGYLARGEIRRDTWGDTEGAIADFKELINREPDNPDNYRRLGYIQLKFGQIGEATQTYQNALPYLDKEDQADILEDLKVLAQEKPELAQPIEAIEAMVKASIP